jgi:hypothetical protein
MLLSDPKTTPDHESFLKLDPLTRQYVKHYSINVTGVPSGAGGGVDSEEPFVFPAPGEDSGDGTEEDGDEDEDPLFG